MSSRASEFAMTESEIARPLGISKATVRKTLRTALRKIRARSQLCLQFRAAVQEKRRAEDARLKGPLLPMGAAPVIWRETPGEGELRLSSSFADEGAYEPGCRGLPV